MGYVLRHKPGAAFGAGGVGPEFIKARRRYAEPVPDAAETDVFLTFVNRLYDTQRGLPGGDRAQMRFEKARATAPCRREHPAEWLKLWFVWR
jgi:hypothetical protein